MGVLAFPAMWLFQDEAAMTSDVHWIMIFLGVLTAVVLVLLLGIAVAGLVIYAKVNKLAKEVERKSQPLLAQATPLVAKGKEIAGHVNEIVADLKPKIAAITSDLQPKIAAVTADLQPKIASVSSDVQHISSVLRSKVDEAGLTLTELNQTVQSYNTTAQEVSAKTRSQVERVDTLVKGQVERVSGMVSDAITSTQHVSRQIQNGIRVPVEKVASAVIAAKLGFEDLLAKIPFLNPKPAGATRVSGVKPGPVAVPPAGGSRL